MTSPDWVSSFWPLVALQAIQIAVMVFVVALLARWPLGNRPRLAHGLWALVLIKCLTPPVWSSEWGVFSWALTAREATLPAVRENQPPTTGTLVTDPEILKELDRVASTVARPADPTTSAMDGTEHPALREAIPQSQFIDRWREFALALWGLGSLLLTITVTTRFLSCRREIRRAAVPHDIGWNTEVDRLCRELRIRRRVELIISKAPRGPAVYGLLRPTIVLPHSLTEGRSISDLEPVLLHELTHLRQGDLGWGLTQLTAATVWWWHPAVWFAVRQLSRTSEVCCDLEVIARRPHARRAYAELLLDLLAQSPTPRALPFTPGMRSGDLTSRRMERIMKGATQPGYWSHAARWITLVAIAATALPGAAWDETKPEEATIQPPEGSAAETDLKEVDDSSNVSVVTVYPLDDIYPRFEEHGISKAGAERLMCEWIQELSATFPSDYDSVEQIPWRAKTDNAMTRAKWDSKGNLFVRALPSMHQQVEVLLRELRTYGLRGFQIHVQSASVPTQQIDKLRGWAAATALERRFEFDGNPRKTDVESKKASQLRFKAISDEEWETILPTAEFYKQLQTTTKSIAGLPISCFSILAVSEVQPDVELVHLPYQQFQEKMKTFSELVLKNEIESPIFSGNEYRFTVTHSQFNPNDRGLEISFDSFSWMIEGDPPEQVGFTFNIKSPFEPTQRVLIVFPGESEDSKVGVNVVTVKPLPINIWHRVGTDDFRVGFANRGGIE